MAVYYSELIRDRHCTYESLHPQAMFKCFKLLPQRTQIVFPTNKRGKCQKKLTDILIRSIFFHMSTLILPMWNLPVITSKILTHVMINEFRRTKDSQCNEMT